MGHITVLKRVGGTVVPAWSFCIMDGCYSIIYLCRSLSSAWRGVMEGFMGEHCRLVQVLFKQRSPSNIRALLCCPRPSGVVTYD